jgi:hypothetical protein
VITENSDFCSEGSERQPEPRQNKTKIASLFTKREKKSSDAKQFYTVYVLYLSHYDYTEANFN